MSKFTTFANDILDMAYNNGSSGAVALAAGAYTLPIKAELTTSVSVAATPGTLVSGGSYAAQSLAGNVTTAASAGSKANTGALSYSLMPACTVADVYTRDSTGTPKPMNFRGGTTLGKVVNSGDTFIIPIGGLTGGET